MIVQVGDLVHRGPGSHLVVGLVDGLLRSNPSQWVQLVGNHELPYVLGYPRFYPEVVDSGTAGILRGWFREGLLRFGFAGEDGAGREYVVSHAGVSAGFYDLVGRGSAGGAWVCW